MYKECWNHENVRDTNLHRTKDIIMYHEMKTAISLVRMSRFWNNLNIDFEQNELFCQTSYNY
jgi:hypothetical protein